MKNKFLGVISSLFFLSYTASAEIQNLRDWIHSPYRPDMIQVLKYRAFIEPERGIPVSPGRGWEIPRWKDILLRHTPRIIASMEMTYPGATWVFIGRDTQAIADTIEAFYLALEQQHRVKRLNMSSGTLKGLDDQTLYAYLQDSGFSFKKLDHPFILVDTISSGCGRQARAVLRAIYRAYLLEKSGRNAADLIRKVNLFGLKVSTFQGEMISYQDVPDYFKKLEQDLAEQEKDAYFGQKLVLGSPTLVETAHEAGYEHYTLAWHPPFGPLRTQEQWVVGQNGVRYVKTEKSASIPEDNLGWSGRSQQRKSILWLQNILWHGVMDPIFLTRVKYEALKRGYHFPLQRPRSAEDLKQGDLRQLPMPELELIAQYQDRLIQRYGEEARAWRKENKDSFNDSDVAETIKRLHEWAYQQIQPDALALEGVRWLRDLLEERVTTWADINELVDLYLYHTAPSYLLAEEVQQLLKTRKGKNLHLDAETQMLFTLLETLGRGPSSCEEILHP